MTFKKSDWVGRSFRCKETGEVFIIPEEVRPKYFFSFGNCMIDVGDGFYARFGGPIEEIFEESDDA